MGIEIKKFDNGRHCAVKCKCWNSLPWQQVCRVCWSRGSVQWRHSVAGRHWSDVRHWSLAVQLTKQRKHNNRRSPPKLLHMKMMKYCRVLFHAVISSGPDLAADQTGPKNHHLAFMGANLLSCW